MRRALFLSAGLLTWHASAAAAQCADGSPPPCALARRGVTTSRTPPPPAARARRFLLLPFRNVTRGVPQEWLVTGAPLMFGSVLGEFRDLYVVSEERVTAARRRLGLPPDVVPDATQLRRLAEETDGWTAVTGNVFASGGRLRITVQALDVMTSRVIVRAEREVAADADVRDAFDRLGVSLLEAAGVPAATPDLRALTTRSVDAYRAFVQGVAFYQQSAFRRAEGSFKEAVQLDSTFALAWANLAMASAGTGGVQAMVNPGSTMYRAVEQAARHATRLPPRQAQLIRSMQALMHGQITRALRLADSLASTDRDDLDVRAWLASGELILYIVDTTASPPRPKASPNHGMALVREVLERDPGRRSVYLSAMYLYGLSAGLWWGELWGYKQEAASFAAMLMRGPDVSYIPVVGDSIVLMVRSEFERLSPPQQARIRRRNADAAMAWVERWLAAGPEDAEAHAWAARIADVLDDFPRALRELAVAESLGVESSLENMVGLRLQVLVRSGQYATAGAVADSLLTAAALASKPFISWLDRRRPYAAAALLLTKRWTRAAALGDVIGPPAVGRPTCGSLRNELVGGDQVPALQPRELRHVMDTVAMHRSEALAVPSLARCVETLATALAVDSVATPRAVPPAAAP